MSERKPLRVSWSSLLSWESCKQKSFLMGQRKKNPATDIRGFFPGTVVDRVSRDWLASGNQEPGAMVAMVDSVMDREETTARETGDGIVRWRDQQDKLEVSQFCKELVTRLEPILFDLVVPHETYFVDYRFRVEVSIPGLNGEPTIIQLIGAMDYLVHTTDGYCVWDLKGTRNNSYWRKTLAQLTFYDLGTHGMFKEYPVRTGLIQPMCDERIIETTVTDRERTELMTRIIRMAHSIWRGETEPCTHTGECWRCPVKHACSMFDKGFAGTNQFA